MTQWLTFHMYTGLEYFMLFFFRTLSKLSCLTFVFNDLNLYLQVEVIFGFHTTVFKDVPVVIATVPVLHYNFDNCL